MASKTDPGTASTGHADSGSPGQLCAALDETDADARRATEIRLRAALEALRKIKDLPWSTEQADEMQFIAEDALIEDGLAEDNTPPTALELLEDWQTAHKNRDAAVKLCGYWSQGVCRVTLTPHGADEYSREVMFEHSDRETAIRDALKWWDENCEKGRREAAELEAHWERVDAERERRRRKAG